MSRYLLMLAPSANRVYAGETARLAGGELAVSGAFATSIGTVTLAGVEYLGFDADLDPGRLATLAGQSASLALFEQADAGLLRPVELPRVDLLDDDLVTIPKYQGKTNEQFTRLLMNVTLACVDRESEGPRQVLDPLSGRGTTLETAWMMGHEAYGVEGDAKAVEHMAAYLKSWLRRKRIKHTADLVPVRREGKSLGRKFEAELRVDDVKLAMIVFTGDTRTSAALFGRKKFDAIVTDAPYGVVHGSTTDVRGVVGKRDRSPAGLLGEAIPVWASMLKPGGALGLSWNTYGISREDLASLMVRSGLRVRDEEPFLGFAHRVDSSINRDLIVAVRPR
ncbi:MAG TPA: site-specific DNA-methyltransferase [Propionibacteriaceae bacterium]|mgnify:CR=1 FL=1|nr:site-specific DNA-methyltransferase [Propionibacteriaceae bacterium]